MRTSAARRDERTATRRCRNRARGPAGGGPRAAQRDSGHEASADRRRDSASRRPHGCPTLSSRATRLTQSCGRPESQPNSPSRRRKLLTTQRMLATENYMPAQTTKVAGLRPRLRVIPAPEPSASAASAEWRARPAWPPRDLLKARLARHRRAWPGRRPTAASARARVPVCPPTASRRRALPALPSASGSTAACGSRSSEAPRPAGAAGRRDASPKTGHGLQRSVGRPRPSSIVAVTVAAIAAKAVGRHEAHDTSVSGIDHQPAIVSPAVDGGDRIEKAAQSRRPEWGEPVFAQHGIDFRRRQQRRTVF